MEESQDSRKGTRLTRRDVLKSLATVPVLGAFAYALYRKKNYDRILKSGIMEETGMSQEPVKFVPGIRGGKTVRLGIIGYGIRGPHLLRGAGYAHPDWIDNVRTAAGNNPADKRYLDFMEQEDLDVTVTAVCDVFSVYAGKAQEAGANSFREGRGGRMGEPPAIYTNYRELMASGKVDAVIIATPDHWHGPMTIEAARNGVHVYCEKPMTWSVAETYEVVRAVKESGITFQLGHQGRQTESYIKAREAVEKNLLGKVNLIEVTTNRNDPNGAWVYPIHPEAGPETIDWKQFIGQAPWHEFSLERFFRWRCWWDYSTGLSGDLLTHEYDAMNQILNLGIPGSAVSSGGVYFFKDGRTVPDVLHTVFEYPDRELSLVYSATLASNRQRGKVIMGHDGSMELGETLVIRADRASTRYREKIKDGTIKPDLPIYAYSPGKKKIDAITSATEQYFAGRGLLYTYRGGKRMDTTYLHVREWIDAIRKEKQPSCDIDQGFEEAMTAHMGTMAYHEKRKVFWDPEKKVIL